MKSYTSTTTAFCHHTSLSGHVSVSVPPFSCHLNDHALRRTQPYIRNQLHLYRHPNSNHHQPHRRQTKSTGRNLASFDYEPNNDRPKKDEENQSSSNSTNRNSDRDRDSDNDDHDEDDYDHEEEYSRAFLVFDDEALLEELIELSDDLDVDSDLIDIDDELKQLERLIDEQTNRNTNITSTESISLDNINDDNDDIINIKGEQDMNNGNLDYRTPPTTTTTAITSPISSSPSSSALEEALLQGVVPASAGVGSNCLPGDYGFDPFGLSTKDYFKQAQTFFLGLIPSSGDGKVDSDSGNGSDSGGGAALPLNPKLFSDSERPPALILRDYREAEIRHGRLAMLAAILWPLQEIGDRLFIPESFGHTTLIYGGVTLPFISLFMTLTMLLLGYLDIYAASIKVNESGDAFLPGECFWDPLSMLDGAPDYMKRKMQERELNNGRIAMVAVLSYIVQEGITHEPVINLPWNQILFEPAFEIPEVQAWLDRQFAGGSINSISVETFDVTNGETGNILDQFNDVIIDNDILVNPSEVIQIPEEIISLD